MDTIKGEREKTSMKQVERRNSIEVGCLLNGQLGSMVVEELKRDFSKAVASVYDTFHGAEQGRVVVDKKRSRSWSICVSW